MGCLTVSPLWAVAFAMQRYGSGESAPRRRMTSLEAQLETLFIGKLGNLKPVSPDWSGSFPVVGTLRL